MGTGNFTNNDVSVNSSICTINKFITYVQYVHMLVVKSYLTVMNNKTEV
jgi:hypothetical protein